MLQLLDGAGELAQSILDPVDAHVDVGGIVGLRDARLLGRRRLGLALWRRLLAAAEQIIEEAGRGTLLLRHRGRRQQQQSQRGQRRTANSGS